jgi:predicted transcriptional regulator
MSSIEQIEEAVRQLSRQDLATFREWFAEYDAELWGHQMEEDIKAGRLDSLAEKAHRDFNEGRCMEL